MKPSEIFKHLQQHLWPGSAQEIRALEVCDNRHFVSGQIMERTVTVNLSAAEIDTYFT